MWLFSSETNFGNSQCNINMTYNMSPLIVPKNAFLFTLKALFVLKIFQFLSLDSLVVCKNDLMRKIRLISKFMTLYSD